MPRPAPLRPALAAGLVAVVGLAAAGCGWNDDVDSRAATAGLPSTRADLEARDWVLDRDDSSLEVDHDGPVTLDVEGDVVSGQAPCNSYRGTIDLGNDGSVEIHDVATTLMACPGRASDAETEYLEALEAVDHVDVDVDDEGRDDADRMVLTGPDGLRLAFRSYDAGDLLVGTWDIVGVNTGDSIDSVIAGTSPTVTFADGGDVTLVTGCNDAGGTWELDGHDLTVSALRSTMMACDDPPGVMDQETALGRALRSAARVEIAPGTLTILDDRGAIALVAAQG